MKNTIPFYPSVAWNPADRRQGFVDGGGYLEDELISKWYFVLYNLFHKTKYVIPHYMTHNCISNDNWYHFTRYLIHITWYLILYQMTTNSTSHKMWFISHDTWFHITCNLILYHDAWFHITWHQVAYHIINNDTIRSSDANCWNCLNVFYCSQETPLLYSFTISEISH